MIRFTTLPEGQRLARGQIDSRPLRLAMLYAAGIDLSVLSGLYLLGPPPSKEPNEQP